MQVRVYQIVALAIRPKKQAVTDNALVRRR